MVRLTQSTKPVSIKEITPQWHLIDVKGKVLGRTATEIAALLIGKRKRNYVTHLDMGDSVVVVNAGQVVVTGRKEQNKVYSQYSGYPGGLKRITYEKMKSEKPSGIIRHAVWGMLPKNKLRDRMITRLFIYKDDKHPYEDKLKSQKLKIKS